MKKIVYLPLDERPCNYAFAGFLSEENPSFTLVRPATEILGKKKIPADSEKANSIVGNVMGNIDSALSTTSSSNSNVGSGVLTTYATDSATASSNGGYNSSPKKSSDGIDFGYLAELMSETYANDEQASKALSAYSSLTATTETQSVIQKTVQTIKENPEVAVAPTGIIALGGLGGYIWTKRKKNSSEVLSFEKSDDENETED